MGASHRLVKGARSGVAVDMTQLDDLADRGYRIVNVCWGRTDTGEPYIVAAVMVRGDEGGRSTGSLVDDTRWP